MKARLGLLAVFVLALTACGHATDSVTFTAPPAFHEKASFGPFMQIWEGEPHTVLMLMALPVAADLNKAMDQANLKDAKVQKNEHIKICGGSQDAVFAQLEGETTTGSSSSGPSEIEFLATNVAGKTYMAMYARPLHTAPDSAAEAAIRNVCPK
ncbi:MAG TPA: hypothetical protein VFN49_13220 [Candidatus Aquilonibacter sp.]|nr:hypothetical protein [Candidatus Aquilonibacter sp.]